MVKEKNAPQPPPSPHQVIVDHLKAAKDISTNREIREGGRESDRRETISQSLHLCVCVYMQIAHRCQKKAEQKRQLNIFNIVNVKGGWEVNR